MNYRIKKKLNKKIRIIISCLKANIILNNVMIKIVAKKRPSTRELIKGLKIKN